jgi:hypothetical protein
MSPRTADMLAAYAAGERPIDIAARFGVAPSAVTKAATYHGLAFHRPRHSRETIDAIMALRGSRAGYVALRFGLTPNAVRIIWCRNAKWDRPTRVARPVTLARHA